MDGEACPRFWSVLMRSQLLQPSALSTLRVSFIDSHPTSEVYDNKRKVPANSLENEFEFDASVY